ncbi:hypothetical protein CTRI78_v003454 [Colletotrichum trifolii]|uniref:Uncharacterized protein n=1 Tax=Colletotrichum trifolii TaxID=5466 RepID=A0A4R8RJG2_COLTR|nr:hypothetical protein CTRI78_v003454 [Colletotrichum trifolii]
MLVTGQGYSVQAQIPPRAVTEPGQGPRPFAGQNKPLRANMVCTALSVILRVKEGCLNRRLFRQPGGPSPTSGMATNEWTIDVAICRIGSRPARIKRSAFSAQAHTQLPTLAPSSCSSRPDGKPRREPVLQALRAKDVRGLHFQEKVDAGESRCSSQMLILLPTRHGGRRLCSVGSNANAIQMRLSQSSTKSVLHACENMTGPSLSLASALGLPTIISAMHLLHAVPRQLQPGPEADFSLGPVPWRMRAFTTHTLRNSDDSTCQTDNSAQRALALNRAIFRSFALPAGIQVSGPPENPVTAGFMAVKKLSVALVFASHPTTLAWPRVEYVDGGKEMSCLWLE